MRIIKECVGHDCILRQQLPAKAGSLSFQILSSVSERKRKEIECLKRGV